MHATPLNGNITCGSLVAHYRTGDYSVPAGGECILGCKRGYVTLENKKAKCFNGRWTSR
jgi:hypothetical protein